MVFGAIAVILALFLYLTSQQDKVGVEEEEQIIMQEESKGEITAIKIPDITGETQFGYMKEGYGINVDVAGKTRQLYIKSLNDDGTVDIALNRAYNVEIGETVYADYDYDGYADISFTLDGIDLYAKRFSMTLTYYGVMPDEIVTKS